MTGWLRHAWQRLRNDDQLAIISSYAACALAGILPFSIYRFATGNVVAGALDLAIVTLICLAVAHVWRGGTRERAGLVLAIINTVGCLASATLLGPPGLFWMYPALLGNFLLLDRAKAVGVTAVAFVFLAVQGKAYDSKTQLAMFLVTATVSGLVAFVFASRTERQRKALETLATLDSLTGVQNRRAMERELSIAVEEHRRARVPFGLAMLDLDHFKRINDEHGHEMGDVALKHVAMRLRSACRGAELPARQGGEEFVVLFDNLQLHDAPAAGERLRQAVAQAPFTAGDLVLPLTVSIGLAVLRADDAHFDSLLRRADEALYAAKAAGRNRVEVAL